MDKRHDLGLGVEREAPRSVYRVLCACGYKVRCEVARYGERLGELVFFDDRDASADRGERVRHCPGCQGPLGLPGLRT